MERTHPIKSWRLAQDPPINRAKMAERAGLTPGALKFIEASASGCGRKAALGLERATGGAITLRALLEWPTNAELAAERDLEAVS